MPPRRPTWLSLLVCLAPAVAGPSPAAPPADTAPLAPQRVERLAAVARLWGKVKHFHPYLGSREIDWDRALLEALPRLEAAADVGELRAALDGLLAPLGDPLTRTLLPGEGSSGEDEPGARIPRQDGGPAAPRLEWLPGRIAYLDARRAGAAPAAGDDGGAVLAPLFAEARGGAGLILDLRAPAGGLDLAETSLLDDLLATAWPVLFDREVVLPALRTRLHDGYPPQDGMTSGGYSSGVFQRDHLILRGTSARPAPRLVILGSDGGIADPAVLAGLELAGLATVIHTGRHNPYDTLARVRVVETLEGVAVAMRTGELVAADGRAGLAPAFTLPPEPTAGADRDAARELAADLLRGERQRPPAGPAPHAFPQFLSEERHGEAAYPPRGLRLLALFRLWNVADLFFPYDHLLDRPWESVLGEFLPRFAAAPDELAYHLAVAELAARLEDTHAFVSSPVLLRHLHGARLPLRLRFLGGRWVVTQVLDEALAARGEVRAGDLLLSIDGESVAAREERLGRFFAASTPQARRWRVAGPILAGEPGSESRLVLEGEGGTRREVTLARTALSPAPPPRAPEPRPDVFTHLPSGFGYIDLTRLEVAQVPEALESLRDTPGLILDMRGYPRGTAWAITPYLAAEARRAARFRRPMAMTLDRDAITDFTFEQRFPAGGPWQYRGKIAVLIDERAISQAEHSCLFFESAHPDVTFLGTPTNGANGDVTNVPLPGGILVYFSGHDVRHADGRQLQRRGIQPDIWVEPTPAGIRAGRDEVLEAAVRFLQEATPAGPGT